MHAHVQIQVHALSLHLHCYCCTQQIQTVQLICADMYVASYTYACSYVAISISGGSESENFVGAISPPDVWFRGINTVATYTRPAIKCIVKVITATNNSYSCFMEFDNSHYTNI